MRSQAQSTPEMDADKLNKHTQHDNTNSYLFIYLIVLIAMDNLNKPTQHYYKIVIYLFINLLITAQIKQCYHTPYTYLLFSYSKIINKHLDGY